MGSQLSSLRCWRWCVTSLRRFIPCKFQVFLSNPPGACIYRVRVHALACMSAWVCKHTVSYFSPSFLLSFSLICVLACTCVCAFVLVFFLFFSICCGYERSKVGIHFLMIGTHKKYTWSHMKWCFFSFASFFSKHLCLYTWKMIINDIFLTCFFLCFHACLKRWIWVPLRRQLIACASIVHLRTLNALEVCVLISSKHQFIGVPPFSWEVPSHYTPFSWEVPSHYTPFASF